MQDSQNLKSKWASIPGVYYPEDKKSEAEEALKRLPEGWKTTAQLLEMTGISSSSLLQRLRDANVQHVILGHQRTGMRAWAPEGYKAVLADIPPSMPTVPEGWLTTAEAMSILEVKRKRFTSLWKKGKIKGKKVVLKGLIQYIWDKTSINKAVNEMKAKERKNTPFVCPICEEENSIMEITDCIKSVPVINIVRDEDGTCTYDTDERLATYPMEDGTVYLRCSACNSTWKDAEDLLDAVASVAQKKEENRKEWEKKNGLSRHT